MAAMDDIINKDTAAFVKQLEVSNPECRVEAQYAPTIDFTKHVKNLSVRYVSTVLPQECNLDDWIVLPLFQHGQDIPIDNDGRTAILLAHAPSLERLLEMWRERLDSEHFDRKEKRRHKAERRENHHKRRSEKRRLKEPQEVENCSKRSKLEDGIEPEICEAIADKKSQDAEERAISAPQLNYTANAEHRSNPVCNKQAGLPLSFEHQQKAQVEVIAPSRSPLKSSSDKAPTDSVRSVNNFEVDERMDVDESEIIAMEKQIANIQDSKLVLDTKTRIEHEICRESVHAACNLERELNGEPMECKKFKESLIRVETPYVVLEPLPELITEQRPTKAELKKNSASNKIKTSLLQRMAEGHEVDVDATNAAASENDYKNTFCYLCRIDFHTSKALYLHNVKSHSEGEVQCDICYKPLKNRITLMKHKKLHLGAEDMHCLCTECGRPFKDKRALTAHVTYTRHMLGVSANPPPPQS